MGSLKLSRLDKYVYIIKISQRCREDSIRKSAESCLQLWLWRLSRQGNGRGWVHEAVMEVVEQHGATLDEECKKTIIKGDLPPVIL